MGLSPEMGTDAGADAVTQAEGSTEAPQWPSARVPPGSESRACVPGVAQEPGRPRRQQTQEDRGSEPELEPPSEASRSETGAAGSRSLSVVPRKPENRPEGAGGGKGQAGTRNRWRGTCPGL